MAPHNANTSGSQFEYLDPPVRLQGSENAQARTASRQSEAVRYDRDMVR